MKQPQCLTTIFCTYTAANKWDDSATDAAIDALIAAVSSQAKMLSEYFGIKIVDLQVASIPWLLNRDPSLDEVAAFIVCICKNVKWDEEYDCLHQICHEITQLHIRACFNEDAFAGKNHADFVKHELLEILRSPAIGYSGDSSQVIKITDTNELYKIFERC